MHKMAVLLAVALVVGLSEPGAPATIAAGAEVDVELVLAVDISLSLDYGEQVLQRQGYVAAFRHPDIMSAIKSGPYGSIAVTYVEWAGVNIQTVIAPWRILASREDAEAFAAELEAAPIVGRLWTSISAALLFAAELFDDSPVAGLRRTVDVSGDGTNNEGRRVTRARDMLLEDGITINGLPIMISPSGLGPRGNSFLGLDTYYENCVIGGPGAFMITIDDAAQFEVAVRRKLVLEIAGLPPRLMPAAHTKRRPEPPVDCLIGEKYRPF